MFCIHTGFPPLALIAIPRRRRSRRREQLVAAVRPVGRDYVVPAVRPVDGEKAPSIAAVEDGEDSPGLAHEAHPRPRLGRIERNP